MLSIHLSNSKWLPRHDLKNLGRYDAEIISTGYLPLVSITTTVEAGAWLSWRSNATSATPALARTTLSRRRRLSTRSRRVPATIRNPAASSKFPWPRRPPSTSGASLVLEGERRFRVVEIRHAQEYEFGSLTKNRHSFRDALAFFEIVEPPMEVDHALKLGRLIRFRDGEPDQFVTQSGKGVGLPDPGNDVELRLREPGRFLWSKAPINMR